MKRRTFLSTTAAAAVGTQVLGGVPLKAFSPFDLGENVPMANLYLRMLEEFGTPQKHFGDSNGVLKKV